MKAGDKAARTANVEAASHGQCSASFICVYLRPSVVSNFSSWFFPSEMPTAGRDAPSPAVAWSNVGSIAMPATLTTIIIPIAPPIPAAIPAPVPPAIVIPIMAVVMTRQHNHHRARPMKRRMDKNRPGMNRARQDQDRRRTDRPWRDDHGWRIHRPGRDDDWRRAQRRGRRDHHPGRRREAEGNAEVEVRPRRGGNRESQGEGTDCEYGFGFHNASFDGHPRPRFEPRPLIELIASSTRIAAMLWLVANQTKP